MRINTISNLLDCVQRAGEIALKRQRKINYFSRNYKDDGSIITNTDKEVESYLIAQIISLYPQANILTEETIYTLDPNKMYYFAIDPIDGTDVYAQGMFGWSVSVGLLDKSFRPIAGIVFAPILNMLLFADVGKSAILNNKAILLPDLPEQPTKDVSVIVPTTFHKQINMYEYPGKIHCIGSAALHLCFPLIYPAVFAAIESRGAHVWDIAGAHAINRSVGFDFEL
jgi:myo-inositol-1(or 4)-monophosphatase